MNKKSVVFLKILMLLSFAFLVSCATAGKNFPTQNVAKIKINETSKKEVKKLFGSPWRTGIEDGYETWTYGNYKYRAIGKSDTKDLVIRFDEKNIVSSYTFNTTEHNE